MTEKKPQSPLLVHNISISKALKHRQDDVPEDYIKTIQTEITEQMRETVVEWLLAVCQEEQCQPQIFHLTVNILDRVLSRIKIKTSQLQCLASACLLVSWKIRSQSTISAVKIVKYTSFNVKLEELLEWEVYVLSKLSWNIPSIVALDFVEHILKQVSKLKTEVIIDSVLRSRIQVLINQSYLSYHVARYSPSVIAAAAVILAAKSHVSSPAPDPSSPACSNTSSPELSRVSPSSSKSPFKVSESPIARVPGETELSNTGSSPELFRAEVDRITKTVARITLVDKTELSHCSSHLAQLSSVSRPQTPDTGYSDTSSSGGRFSTSSPLPIAARSLFKDLESSVKTPTKILDASTENL